MCGARGSRREHLGGRRAGRTPSKCRAGLVPLLEAPEAHSRVPSAQPSFKTTNASDLVAQSIGTFERAAEHGVPKSAGTPADALLLGYTFDNYDLRTAFTWKFLRSADRRQVDAVINGVLESDTKLVTGTILRRLFDPTEGATEFGARVFGLYTGIDGVTPPPYLGDQLPSHIGAFWHPLAERCNPHDAGAHRGAGVGSNPSKEPDIAPGSPRGTGIWAISPLICEEKEWSRLGSNQRPLACEASALPLSYETLRSR